MKWPGRVLAAATGLFGIKPPSTVHIVGDTYLDVIAKIQDVEGITRTLTCTVVHV